MDTNKNMDIYKYNNGLRQSNLELLRIIAMLFIIAHHYVVNSGLLDVIALNPTSMKSIVLLIFGGWGKTAINCFVLITGYFMCTSKITVKKYIKLLSEIYFYRIIFYVIFLLSGYSVFSFKGFIKAFLPFTQIRSNFTGCFLLFYLCIPFLNILIKNMSKIMHFRLVVLLSFIYVFCGSVPFIDVSMNYVSWFCYLFVVASFIRLNKDKLFNRNIKWGGALLIMLLLSVFSIALGTFFGVQIDKDISYYFVSDSNKILSIGTGICAFMYFKNLKVLYNRIINQIAASTFGVLLIHANSDTMREWLWKDMLNNAGMYNSDLIYIHALLSVVGIFAICIIIDILRIRFFEKRIVEVFICIYDIIKNFFCKFERKIFSAQKIETNESRNQDIIDN